MNYLTLHQDFHHCIISFIYSFIHNRIFKNFDLKEVNYNVKIFYFTEENCIIKKTLAFKMID